MEQFPDQSVLWSIPTKKAVIQIGENKFARRPIKTHFIKPKENYIEIMRQYVLPEYKDGDIVSISEKIIALCQNRIIHKKDMKLGFWAKLLSRFVTITPAGRGVGNPYKMQAAIKCAGLLRILFAAGCGMIGKIFGIKGIFYKIAGNGVAGIDGFNDEAFKEYDDIGILNPENPDKVCDEIYNELGIVSMIVDANDLDIVILGKSKNIGYSSNDLKEMIRDNPAGQSTQQTPFIIIRKASQQRDVS